MIDQLPAHSRVWIYQNTKELSNEKVDVLKQKIDSFLANWSAHGSALMAASSVVYNRFIIISIAIG